jgi:hypothetical protein
VYNVAGGKSLPEWLSEKKREALRKDEEFRRRIELIQELDFPCSSGRVKLSSDGQFLAVTGIHPPMARSRAARARMPCAALTRALLRRAGQGVRAVAAGAQV